VRTKTPSALLHISSRGRETAGAIGRSVRDVSRTYTTRLQKLVKASQTPSCPKIRLAHTQVCWHCGISR
jgi:hypothetical protein